MILPLIHNSIHRYCPLFVKEVNIRSDLYCLSQITILKLLLYPLVIASKSNQTLLRAVYSFPTMVAIIFRTVVPRQFL